MRVSGVCISVLAFGSRLRAVLLSTPHLFACSRQVMAGVQIQAPMVTGSPGQSSQAEGDTLISRLDELLEQYLHTLNEYQKAREQLSKQLSSVSFKYAAPLMMRLISLGLPFSGSSQFPEPINNALWPGQL